MVSVADFDILNGLKLLIRVTKRKDIVISQKANGAISKYVEANENPDRRMTFKMIKSLWIFFERK